MTRPRGEAKSVGACNFNAALLRELIDEAAAASAGGCRPAIVQNRCLAKTGWDREVRDLCRAHGIVYQATGLLEANVYGVAVPGAEGRAGMASLHVGEDFSLEAFTEQVLRDLPVYQRPYFLRLQQDMRITGTFKHQKVEYRREAFDPGKVSDPLYFLDGEKYVPLDAALYESIRSGETRLR